MSKKGTEPTLADRVYRASFELPRRSYWTDRAAVRQLLFEARRFVLDDKMSSFLADISTAAFMQRKTSIVYCRNPSTGISSNSFLRTNRPRAHRLIEQLRLGARLPHKSTWVEYNAIKWFDRDTKLMGYSDTPPTWHQQEGWLLRRYVDWHAVNLFTVDPETGVLIFPWTFIWTVDDKTLPLDEETWSDRMMFCLGIDKYHNKRVACYPSEWCTFTPKQKEHLEDVLAGQTGVMRRVLAFLSTINDIPVLAREIKTAKGFVARGNYRRFLDHQTITLMIPQEKDTRKLARQIVAAARRRLHMVRGHWRKDFRQPLSPLCEHEFMTSDPFRCKRCSGHRLWIREHERGDATLGVVMTDYEIVH